MEIYGKTTISSPAHHRGKDEYNNLQLLHKHCHDDKTAKDDSTGDSSDNTQVIEEPDEVKVSRPVL